MYIVVSYYSDGSGQPLTTRINNFKDFIDKWDQIKMSGDILEVHHFSDSNHTSDNKIREFNSVFT